ncbi:MAG: iron-sulfur cluster repair di-iron protein [Saccharofermentanales bacterium]
MSDNNLFSKSNSVGSMVTEFPKAAEVFNQFKIDYCCAGRDSLLEASAKVNADPDEVAAALAKKFDAVRASGLDPAKGAENVNYEAFSNEDLIDHILGTHHVYTKKAFQELDDLVLKILKVHFDAHSEELLEVHKLFGMLKTELEEHLIKEEEQLFPAMFEYEQTGSASRLAEIRQSIGTTEDEHLAAGEILKKLEAVTRDFTPPAGVCPTYIRTYKGLDELEKNIFEHIHKETSILFKRYIS